MKILNRRSSMTDASYLEDGNVCTFQGHLYIKVSHDCIDVSPVPRKVCLVNLKTGGIRFIDRDEGVQPTKAHVKVDD